MKPSTVALAVLAAAGAIVHAQTIPPPAPYDIILRHGTILDGSGLPRFTGDLAIARGRIARIGNLANARAGTDLDVAGLFVAPGFINLHSHASSARFRGVRRR